MLRFWHVNFGNKSDIIDDKLFIMDSNIWQNCRSFLQNFGQKKEHIIDLIPIKKTDDW